MQAPGPSATDLEGLRNRLQALRDRNLDDVTFEEKLEIIARLNIQVFPAEDLKSMKVSCRLVLPSQESERRTPDLDQVESQSDGESEPALRCGKVLFAPPLGARTRYLAVRASSPQMELYPIP